MVTLTLTRTGPGVRLAAVPALRLNDRRDPWLRMGPMVGMTFPSAGQPGHGRTGFVRRQPIRIVDGRVEGGYTGLFDSSALAVAIILAWITPRSRRGFSGSAGRSR